MTAPAPARVDSNDIPSRGGCVWRTGRTQPYASVWALWSSLCGINCLNQGEALRLRGGRSPFISVFATTADDTWLRAARDVDAIARAAACAVSEQFDSKAVAMNYLRFCPTCMAQEYHAACFQHRALSHCPVHAVPLVEHCRECGKLVNVHYEAARRMPFSCPTCSTWLAKPRRVRDEPGLIRSAMQSTTLALDRTKAHHGLRRVDAKRWSGRPSQIVGHATWWWGEDPFIVGSRWQPWAVTLMPSDDPPDILHADAWKVLVQFVARLQMGRGGLEVPTQLAEAIEHRACGAWHQEQPPLSAWALASLIYRYGGARQLRQAWRLGACGARAELYPLSPQASLPVEAHAQANGIVFEAELRAELVHRVRWIRRHGFDELFELDGCNGVSVPWTLSKKEDGCLVLQWRGLGLRRFERVISQRTTPAEAT